MCVCIFTQAKNSGRLLVKMTFFDLKISMIQKQKSILTFLTNLSRSIFMFIFTLIFIFNNIFIITNVKCKTFWIPSTYTIFEKVFMQRYIYYNIKWMKTKWLCNFVEKNIFRLNFKNSQIISYFKYKIVWMVLKNELDVSACYPEVLWRILKKRPNYSKHEFILIMQIISYPIYPRAFKALLLKMTRSAKIVDTQTICLNMLCYVYICHICVRDKRGIYMGHISCVLIYNILGAPKNKCKWVLWMPIILFLVITIFCRKINRNGDKYMLLILWGCWPQRQGCKKKNSTFNELITINPSLPVK